MRDPRLSRLREVLSCPTAPFLEQAVIDYVAHWAKRRRIDFRQDEAGNVWLSYHRGRKRKPHWVYQAHMDHPGFACVRQRDARTLTAEFRGGVKKEYFLGSKVRFFAPQGETRGVIRTVQRVKASGFYRCRVELHRPADVPPGSPGMWDLPKHRRRGQRIIARACDDLAGTAAILCAMDELCRRRTAARVTGLLTRAEEVGFIGTMEICRRIPEQLRGARIIGLEASRAMPNAPMGGGVVLRVGDRLRTFDATLSGAIAGVAEQLTKKDRGFRYVRQLMPGGACESTAWSLYGLSAAALCVPLGNYHNMSPRGRIAAEQIHRNDFTCLVKLLVALASDNRRPGELDDALRKRLESRRDRLSPLLGR